MTRLTNQRLAAIIEALTARLAGEIDVDMDEEDYVAALAWALELREQRRVMEER